jgi:Ferredoxin
MHKPKYHLFLCSSSRINGQQMGACHSKKSVDLVKKFIEEIEERELSDDVMITNCGCLGMCTTGPVAVIYPEGTWYGDISSEDVAEIVETHFENDKKVERLEIK